MKNTNDELTPDAKMLRSRLAFALRCSTDQSCTDSRVALVLGRDGTSQNGESPSNRYSFHGQPSSKLSEGIEYAFFLRTFLGQPSKLWLDRFRNLVVDGKRTLMGLGSETLDTEEFNWNEAQRSIRMFARGVGKHASVDCTY